MQKNDFELPLQYPAEMYKDGLYRCTWSVEETIAMTKQGWSLQEEDGKKRKDYKVYHHESAEERRGPGRPKGS